MNYIEQCQKDYYNGTPSITNEEYDSLLRYMREDSIGVAGNVAHYLRMWSLDKKYPNRGDELPKEISSYVKSPKLDGCAVSLLYYNGSFLRGLTRGDGIRGQDITKKLLYLVPAKVDGSYGYMQVTGEVATSKRVENERNFASGALNPLGTDMDEFVARIEEGGLRFVAYTVEWEEEQYETYESSLASIKPMGFSTILDEDLSTIPTDGVVYRLSNMKAYKAAGATAKFNRGAFAVKEDEECVWTVLREVKWGTSASGKVVPVAHFDSVNIGGANVSKATLNNPGYMHVIGLTHIGQEIGIIRAGDIIPKVVETRPFL